MVCMPQHTMLPHARVRTHPNSRTLTRTRPMRTRMRAATRRGCMGPSGASEHHLRSPRSSALFVVQRCAACCTPWGNVACCSSHCPALSFPCSGPGRAPPFEPRRPAAPRPLRRHAALARALLPEGVCDCRARAVRELCLRSATVRQRTNEYGRRAEWHLRASLSCYHCCPPPARARTRTEERTKTDAHSIRHGRARAVTESRAVSRHTAAHGS